MDAREETTDVPGMQQWNKRLTLKGASTSRKRDDIWQDLQEGSCAGDCEMKSPAQPSVRI
jgi:hypothetical protein